MPRRSSRAKPEPDANIETRVTRRSLRGAQPDSPAKAAPAKESPAKPAARGRGSRSTSRRGRSEPEEEPAEEPTVEPAAESEASEEPEETVAPSPKKGKKSPAPARGRGRGRSRGRSPRAAASKPDDAAAEEGEAAEDEVKDTVSPSRRSRRPSAKTTPQTTPTRSRRGRSSVPEAEPEAPMEAEAATDDKEDKKRKREDEEESKPEDEEKAVKKQKVEDATEEDKPEDASKEADTKEAEEAMDTEETQEVKEDTEMAESKEPAKEAATDEEAAKQEETPEKEEIKTKEEPKKAADEDEPMVEEEAPKDEAKTETKEDEAKQEAKEVEAEPEAETKPKEEEPVTEEPEVTTTEPVVATKEPELATEEPKEATKEPEVTTTEPEVAPEVAMKEPEAEQQEPATNEETAEAEPMEEKVEEPETKADQEAETPSVDSSEPKPTEEKMEAAAYAAPDNAEPSDAKDIIKDYVVVNMEDVPASDSTEVSQSVPAEKPAITEESTPNQREETAASDQTAEKVSMDIASNGSTTHLPNSTPTDTQHHNDTAISNGSDTDPSVDPLFSRKFIANPHLAADVDQSQKFSLVSYNILADCHTKPENYAWVEKGSLFMEARSKRLIQELEHLDADIICLQEVSPDYYNNTLAPTLKASGYEGVFKKRVEDYYNEGAATFFRSSQFSLVSHRSLALRDVAFKELEACGLDLDKAAAVKAFIDRPTVVVITQLKSNKSGTLLTVGNLHVSYEPLTNLDRQCIQAACAVKEVVSMSESPNSAHIICGDFNARPESVVYQLTKEGYLNDTSMTALQAMQNVTMKDDTKQALVNLWWKGFQHTSSSLRSCYSTVTGSEPKTTSSSSGPRNVDYIWCGGSNLDIAGVIAASPDSVITAGIPNATYPSDHLSLKAELFFK